MVNARSKASEIAAPPWGYLKVKDPGQLEHGDEVAVIFPDGWKKARVIDIAVSLADGIPFRGTNFRCKIQLADSGGVMELTATQVRAALAAPPRREPGEEE